MLHKTGQAMTNSKKPHTVLPVHGHQIRRHSIKQSGRIDPLFLAHLLVLAVFLFLIVGGAA